MESGQFEHQYHNVITLDIETIPDGVRNESILKSVDELLHEAPQSYSKPKQLEWAEKKSKDLYDVMEKEYRDRSFSALKGRIVCISVKYNSEPSLIIPYDNDEKVMLINLVDRLKYFDKEIYTCYFVGNGIYWFDILFIIQKAYKFGLKQLLDLLPTNKNDKRIFDLSEKFNLGVYGKHTSLKDMCLFFGIPSPKDDLDGSKVLDAFEAGEVDRIEKYCMSDTDAEYKCFLKMQP